ncbi:tyrosine-type recombinase/integrase [Sphingomonas jaspsi]|uniref:tyrosine-type recombinase/integrase n=1 Tax=Sphingomonas jaspsi TaxID=392409 RepID=UPI0004B15865|nr:tyrosine-type recombinase/integrase [Sphingomonas jaspsi]
MKIDRQLNQQQRTTPVPIRPGLSLYRQPKRPGAGSPYWYARARINVGGKKLHTKSTGTTDIRLAVERAEDLYTELQILKRGGAAVAQITSGKLAERCYRFDVVADGFLDALLGAAGNDERRQQRYRDHRAILTAPNGLNAFFKGQDVRTITPGKVRDYLRFAEKRSRKGSLRPTTQRNMLATLRLVLGYGVDEGLLDRVPKMPSVRMIDNPRPSFSRDELDHLVATCRRLADEAKSESERNRWLEMLDFIDFMVGSFLRPSEWVDLTHSQIKIVESDQTPHLEIAVARGKTGKRKVCSMPEAVTAYKRLVGRHGGQPSEFVFVRGRNSRDGAIAWMRKLFESLLEAADLENDEFGAKRVIYSLRHTALSLRIIEGDKVNLILLAKNAGTSVEMLERFYLSRLTPTDDLQNLQSRRRSRPKITGTHSSVLLCTMAFN